MTRQTSIYLDLVRFSAAMIVFVGHLSGVRFSGGMFWQFGAYMDEAVTIFFVLSGLVIAYVIDTREDDAGSYAVARAARIYSVAVPAILLTVVLDSLGMALRPELYNADWGFSAGNYWRDVIGGVFFVNQLWFMDRTVGSMLPYWSLNFEVWYYALFGVLVFAPKRWAIPVVLGMLVFLGPRIASLWPLWLLGVATYHALVRIHVPQVLGWVFCLGPLLVYCAYDLLSRHAGAQDSLEGLLDLRRLSHDYFVGLLFALHLYGFNLISHRFGGILARWQGTIRWVAGATFSIYLLHVPIAQFLTTLTPWPPFAWQTRLVMFGGTLLLIFAIAEVTERRKEPWRRGFAALLACVRRKPATSVRVAPGSEGR